MRVTVATSHDATGWSYTVPTPQGFDTLAEDYRRLSAEVAALDARLQALEDDKARALDAVRSEWTRQTADVQQQIFVKRSAMRVLETRALVLLREGA